MELLFYQYQNDQLDDSFDTENSTLKLTFYTVVQACKNTFNQAVSKKTFFKLHVHTSHFMTMCGNVIDKTDEIKLRTVNLEQYKIADHYCIKSCVAHY